MKEIHLGRVISINKEDSTAKLKSSVFDEFYVEFIFNKEHFKDLTWSLTSSAEVTIVLDNNYLDRVTSFLIL